MRLLFIHGIAQQDYSEAQLAAIWTDHLLDHGMDAAKLAAAEPEMAYYGDALYKWTQEGPHAATTMGGPVPDEEMAFLSAALDQIAQAEGLDEDEIETKAAQDTIAQGATAIAQSTWLGRRVVAIASLLERVSPLRGRVAVHVVRQAYTYLAIPGARKAIDDLVRPRLGTGEVIVVSHSLGTVVAFMLLRDLAKKGQQLHVPLLVTLGSPLAIAEVKRWVSGDFAVPSIVDQWRNYFDKGDPVTLGRALKSEFTAAIHDIIVDNNTANAHSIAGYLDDQDLIDALNIAL